MRPLPEPLRQDELKVWLDEWGFKSKARSSIGWEVQLPFRTHRVVGVLRSFP